MGKHFSEFALRDRMLQYLFLAICISNLNAEAISDSHIQQIFKDFESELEDELQFKMINGATSNHFSKHNNFSREMVKRNTLFKNVVTYLTKEMNMEHEDAKTQARQALIEKDGSYDNRIGNPLCDAAKAIPSCDSSSAFRTINGKCNNLHNPVWGEVNTPFLREILVGDYDSGTAVSTRDANECKDSNENTCALYAHWLCKIDDLKKFCLKTCNACPVEIPSNENYEICPKRTNLPSPRTISNRFHEDLDLPSTKNTHMVTQFGQYLDHDIAETPSHEVEDCCMKGKTDECFPIPVPNDDNFYGPRNVTCLEFRRSVIFCGEKGGSKEQFNEVTHFIDASTVYGSEEEIAHELRTFVNGKLKVTQLDLLPVDDNGVEKAGDHRVNEMPGLAVMHTLFVREHNRLAKLIKLKNPYWDDEKIYQNARRIMIAQHQSITYGEFL